MKRRWLMRWLLDATEWGPLVVGVLLCVTATLLMWRAVVQGQASGFRGGVSPMMAFWLYVAIMASICVVTMLVCKVLVACGRRPRGVTRCPRCGYDRWTPSSERCPECGATGWDWDPED